MNKKANGQFFTTTNPFKNRLFIEWFKKIPNIDKETILEPFAGSGNITKMLENVGFNNGWSCFDIDPPNGHRNTTKQNTIDNYPKGFNVAITNPPYLARNSATRSGIDFPDTPYDDLYKECLNKMLDNTKYVAAIIPESFITSGLFQNRLFGVISLTTKMFDDTDCPVCLALFGSVNTDNFVIYSDSKEIGNYNDIKQHIINPMRTLNLSFNNPNGKIGLYGVDNTKNSSIRFVMGDDIDPLIVKTTSRAVTRIGIDMDDINYCDFIACANDKLNEFRERTNDLFLTSFKGLRADNRYRRRLDYKNAKNILSDTYIQMYG